MNKDTIFLSHSSKDKDALNILKNLLVDKTSSIYNIFLSSDGQSIPFGTNWVHRIEEGLNNAKVMFIFITSNSVKSDWIYFEAGFAYSKGVKVVPIGIGIDVGSINPPLNLLQGFNVTSEEGLNNIVKTINDVFDVTFPENFSEKEYLNFSAFFKSDSLCNIKDNLIDYFKTEILKDYYLNNEKKELDIKNLLFECDDIFKKRYTKYLSEDTSLLSNGIQVKKVFDALIISIDIENFETNISTFKDIIKKANKDGYYLTIVLKPGYDIIVDEVKVSSLIVKSDYITFGNGSTHSYEYKNMSFALFNHPKYRTHNLNIVIRQDTVIETVYGLVNELYNIGVIKKI